MEGITAKYYTGVFHSQFVSDKPDDKKAWKFMNLRLEQRFIFKVEREISINEYEEAKASRLSKKSIEWQGALHPGYVHSATDMEPHILLTDNHEIELEFPDKNASREICSELYVEFNPSIVPDEYKGYEFTAFKDGGYHGRITGKGFVRIPLMTEEEKEQKRVELATKELKKRKGCLAPFAPSPVAGRPVSFLGRLLGLSGGSAGMRGGCGRTGCGLLSLLFLLGLLLSMWRGCSDMGNNGGQRVIHDTVYVDENSKQDVIKRFMDTTTVFKTSAIELPNVQFFTNSAKLLPYSINSIQQLADYLIAHPHINAVIEGHTDNIGDPQANLALSQARSETVREVLMSFGVESDRVEARGYGKNKPRATNETVEGRALNRRVEVRLTNTEHSETKSTEVPNEN